MSSVTNSNAIPMMGSVKVLLVADNVANRFYPFWASRLIDVKEDNGTKEIDLGFMSDSDAVDKSVSCSVNRVVHTG
jgi:hypothetical protein